MSCSKCEIEKSVERISKEKKIDVQNPKLVSRVAFEAVQMHEKGTYRKKIKEYSNKLARIVKNEEILSVDTALALYKQYFKESLMLKLEPISNVDEIDKVRDKLWKVDDKLWQAKRAYERLTNAVEPEEELLKIRIDVRSELYGIIGV